jgi:hypothetical protein
MNHRLLQMFAPVWLFGLAACASITPSGDNELATVTIKNTTDRYVQDMGITWTTFRPVNCAASGTATRIQLATRFTSSACAEDRRGPGPLPAGHSWGARVLLPHEQTDITSLSLSRKSLQEIAKKYNAKKLRVQVGMAQVDFTTGNDFSSRNGPPDWRDENVERTNILDAEDAASAACAEQK